MKYLSIGLIFSFFTAASSANISEEVHQKCKDAKDYVGCVKVFTGGEIAPTTREEQADTGAASVTPPPETVGLGSFQMIKIGDSKQSVLEKVGSPNIITSSEDGGELWIYDKISRSSAVDWVSDTNSKGVIKKQSNNSGSRVAQSSSSTIMSTIYFGSQDKVTDIKYRSSRY